MDFLSHPMSIFVLGMWFGVLWGIIVAGLLRKDGEDDRGTI